MARFRRVGPRFDGSGLRALLVHDRARPIDRATETDRLRTHGTGASLGEHEALDDLAEERALVDLRVAFEEFTLFRSDRDVLP